MTHGEALQITAIWATLARLSFDLRTKRSNPAMLWSSNVAMESPWMSLVNGGFFIGNSPLYKWGNAIAMFDYQRVIQAWRSTLHWCQGTFATWKSGCDTSRIFGSWTNMNQPFQLHVFSDFSTLRMSKMWWPYITRLLLLWRSATLKLTRKLPRPISPNDSGTPRNIPLLLIFGVYLVPPLLFPVCMLILHLFRHIIHIQIIYRCWLHSPVTRTTRTTTPVDVGHAWTS